MEIPLQNPTEPDIYSFGYDKSLNKISPNNVIIADPFTDITNTVRMDKNVITGAGGISLGKVQTSNGSFLAPFDIADDETGNIRRVGAIKLASAGDLGISTLNPAPTANKVIYAMSDDLHINAPTLSDIVTLDTNGKERLAIGIVKSSLSNGATNSIFNIALSGGVLLGGGGTIEWTVTARDGAGEVQSRSGITVWAASNKAGTITSSVSEIGSAVAVSSGTLTGTWSTSTGTNNISLVFTPTSSLTLTALDLYCMIKNNNGNTMTRL